MMPLAHGYAPVNGLEMYYEVHGSGRPLIILHGGAGAIEMYGDVLRLLSQGRQVVAAELQAHARTADIDRPLRYELMADDVVALIRHLKLGMADIMGYSLGGGVALRAAIQHPELVRKLVVVSTACKRNGWYPEVLAAMARHGLESAEDMQQLPLYEVYSRLAPRLEDWPVLMTKLSEMLRREYDWSEKVAKVKAPTMIVVGDADSIRAEHAVEFFGLLGGGKEDAGWDGSGMSSARLAILPGTTHYNIFSSPALASAVTPFLDAPMPRTD